MSSYEYDKVYTLAYRVLYRPSGDSSNPIVETEWKKVKIDNSNDILYFKKVFDEDISVTGSFTDRVTGVNAWMDDAVKNKQITEEKVKELNRYFLDSQVMSKFTLEPKGTGVADIKQYQVDLDVNVSSPNKNNEVNIDYIKIMKIVYENNGEVVDEYYPSREERGKTTMSITVGGNNNDTGTPDPGANKVTVYFEYKFIKNVDKPLDSKEIINRVTVKVKNKGKPLDLDPMENIIRIRDTKGIYR